MRNSKTTPWSPESPSTAVRGPAYLLVPDVSCGSQFQVEIGQLLYRRLRVVGLIALLPLLIFLLRVLADPESMSARDPIGLPLHAAVVVVSFVVTGLLWLRLPWTLCSLRRLELLLFGSLALLFSWLQWRLFCDSTLFEVAARAEKLELVRVYVDSSGVRWFFLIVAYGVFIPNTWKRCLGISLAAAVLPLVLTFVSAWWYDHLSGELYSSLFDLTMIVGTALAISVFGTHRLEVLQKQAFQARQMGQYRLGQRLGSGGMGEVYEAEHVLLRRRCAIKLIRPDQTHDPAVLQRFEREVQAMATLTHPNTVEVFDYGRSSDGTFYYVMEYLAGLNLETLVQRFGPLPPERVIYFLRQVCAALREAHGVGLLHRDIKPSNIIACRRGGMDDVVKLLDFGLVQGVLPGADSARLTIPGAILGSPPFMSPEQAAGRLDLDARTDIYSLGGVGYFLLTGQPPFPRETAMEMLLAHAYEQPIPPRQIRPSIPEDLQAIVLRCLQKKRENRYETVEELSAALQSCAAAGLWTEETAAQWWKQQSHAVQTATTEVLTVAIQSDGVVNSERA